jgi:hypothetical protein
MPRAGDVLPRGDGDHEFRLSVAIEVGRLDPNDLVAAELEVREPIRRVVHFGSRSRAV